ncbi:SDR family oxidoreductase [Maribacter litoralis]|uniref:SDR family oxidoreductase n=1 Tax=Maribacter litoralis TaxID=2059726 RepID=UPI003F5CC3F7
MKNILVTGATGILGTAFIKSLLKQMQPNQISVITRKEEKRAELEKQGFQAYLGDYNDTTALEKAMNGVDTVLLISSGDQGDRMQEHKNVVNSAKKMKVKNIAYTSRSLVNRERLSNKLMEEHFLTEDYIKQSGLNYIIFQNALYMDTIPVFVGQEVFQKGIFMPAGNGKVAFALREEQAEAMANTMLNEPFENQTYKFTGNEAYSFYDVAKALTELSGKEVKYNAVEVADFKSNMKQKGLPEPMVQKIVDFNVDIKNGQEATITNELEKKLGRKPTNLKEGLKQLFNL